MLGEYSPQGEGEQRHVNGTAVAEILKSLPDETGVLRKKKKKTEDSHLFKDLLR